MTTKYILQGHTAKVNCAALSPTNMEAVSGSDDCTIIVWDLKNTQILKKLVSSSPIDSVAYHPKKRVIVSGDADGCHLWDLASGKLVATLALAVQSKFVSVRFSSDGRKVITTSHAVCSSTDVLTEIRVWDLAKKVAYLVNGSADNLSSDLVNNSLIGHNFDFI